MTPLLPEKHVRTSESLIGLGAIVLSSLKSEAKDLDSIWEFVKEDKRTKQSINGSITFDVVILAIDLLFAIGAIRMNGEGAIEYATH